MSEDRIVELERQVAALEVRQAFYQEALKAAYDQLALCGWYPFGTHAGPGPGPDLIFSDLVDEVGLPEFERLAEPVPLGTATHAKVPHENYDTDAGGNCRTAGCYYNSDMAAYGD